MCEEDLFEGLLQEIIYCDSSGHTDKWEEEEWREWLKLQVGEIYQKAKMLDQVEQIILDYSSSGRIKTEDAFDAIFKLIADSLNQSGKEVNKE
jgi:hypothetical protein